MWNQVIGNHGLGIFWSNDGSLALVSCLLVDTNLRQFSDA